jgi:hypothetical protein
MGSSVLTLVQTFADKFGLPSPSALVGATDKSTKQYRALVTETIADLSEYRWNTQRIRGTWVSVAAQLQGVLTTLLPGYVGMEKDSMWDDTKHMRIYGPIADQIWNAFQTLPAAGPEYSMWISRGNIYITPTMVAGDTISCIYVTGYTVLAVDGVTYKAAVTVDSDTVLFPDNVFLRTFEWKWRKQKGEGGWEDSYNEAMALIAKNLVADGGEALSLDSAFNYGPRPGILIPPGSWNV